MFLVYLKSAVFNNQYLMSSTKGASKFTTPAAYYFDCLKFPFIWLSPQVLILCFPLGSVESCERTATIIRTVRGISLSFYSCIEHVHAFSFLLLKVDVLLWCFSSLQNLWVTARTQYCTLNLRLLISGLFPFALHVFMFTSALIIYSIPCLSLTCFIKEPWSGPYLEWPLVSSIYHEEIHRYVGIPKVYGFFF